MKKMLSMVLSASMVLSLAACGGSGKTETTAAPTTPAATAAAQDESAGETGSQAAVSGLDALDPVTLTIYSPGNENSVPTKTILEYKKLVEEASGDVYKRQISALWPRSRWCWWQRAAENTPTPRA